MAMAHLVCQPERTLKLGTANDGVFPQTMKKSIGGDHANKQQLSHPPDNCNSLVF